MERVRRILHLDMDAFYASVAQRDDASLRGNPVAVGGSPEGRGVVMAASYEARAFGVRSAMSMARALRLCPQLLVAKPDFPTYKHVSDTVFALYREVTPLVEPLSLDEAYLDVTENSWHEPLGTNVATRLKALVKEATGLTASAGVAPNKFLAKVGSGWKKPDGLTVVSPQRVPAFLEKLPVEALCGVGPKTAARLRHAGVTRLVHVRDMDIERLRNIVGSFADGLVQLAHGIDHRPVQAHRESKSSGMERTFAQDLTEAGAIGDEVSRMASHAAGWLERRSLYARTIVLKVRYSDFTTITRSHSESPATRDAARLIERAARLLERTEAGLRPVRLLGVSVHGLCESADAGKTGDPDEGLLFRGAP
jgi:DNA polymerase-4